MERKKYLVSIIMLTYNHQRYIKDAVESVIEQTYKNWELIIVDDGSSDNTAKLIYQIIQKNPSRRIKFFKQQHKGPEQLGAIYNSALEKISGDLVAILEGDDKWPFYKLNIQVNDFLDKKIVLSFGNYSWISPNGNIIRTIGFSKYLPCSVLSNKPVGIASWYMAGLAYRTFSFPCTILIRRSSLEQIGGFKELEGKVHLVDYPTFLELSRIGNFKYHQVILGYWRRHINSLTTKSNIEINKEAHKYSIHFLSLHPELLQNKLSVVDKSWKKIIGYSYFEQGRALLIIREWKKARSIFNFLIKDTAISFRLKTIASLGLMCSIMHMDLEPLIDAFKGYSLKKMKDES